MPVLIDASTMATYLAILIAFMFIPGPAVLLTLARAAGGGTRIGLATGLGIAVGDLVHTALAVFGISAVIVASAVLFSIVKYAGAAYLIFLGLRAIFEKAPTSTVPQARPLTFASAFRQAVIAEILNAKSALFFLAFLPQFVNPANGFVAAQLAVLGILFVIVGLAATVVFAVSAGRLGAYLRRHPAVLRWQGKIVGAIFCGVGIRLAFQDR